jgi:hypothetical protein
MNKYLAFFIFFLCFQQVIFSQNKQHLIKGLIRDSINIVKNANVLNLHTKEGSFSSDEGTFEILASLGDSIQISSVPHKTKTVVVSIQDINKQSLKIYLKVKTIVLDEIEIKQNNLTGSLTSDLKKAPTKIRDSILAKNIKYIVNAKSGSLTFDDVDRATPPPNDVDPISNLAGSAIGPGSGGGGGGGLADKFILKERAKKAHLAYIRAFPKKILSDLGEDFFFSKLKIPKQRYFHFLEYCNPLGIEKKYKNGQVLEVIKILKDESKSYLKIINKNNF